MTPNELIRFHHDYPESILHNLVACDTETSGLYADDGARVSTVSLAWCVLDEYAELYQEVAKEHPNLTIRREKIVPGERVWIASIAWPFWQGAEIKGYMLQYDLFEDTSTTNLDRFEWFRMCAWLADRRIVMHNALFDLLMMRVGCGAWLDSGIDLQEQVAWDTQNVNHYLYPTERTSLKPTAQRLFGQEFADEQTKVKAYLRKHKLPSGRWDLMPWSVVGPYADMDARLTMMLYRRQMSDLCVRQDPMADMLLIERRLEVMKMLYRIEVRGLPYDGDESRRVAKQVREAAKDLAAQLPFYPATAAQAKDYWFGGKQPLVQPYAVTESGAPKLTAEEVDRMVLDGVPYADIWAQYRKAETAVSMWYEGYAQAVGVDGRLRARFRQNGTRSSRFSVERVNLQAVPADYRLAGTKALEGLPTPRDLILAGVPDGWKLWELDLAQAELRVAALYAREEKMLQMITDGDDLHSYTTRELFPNVDPASKEFKSKWRQVGKRANFALCFGSGANTFRSMVSSQTGIVLEEAESKSIVTAWNRLYPAYRRAIDLHSSKVELRRREREDKASYLVLKNGERRWFSKEEHTHKTFNQRVQGDLAQYGCDWWLRGEAYLQTYDLDAMAQADGYAGAGLVMLIHDSMVLLLPDDSQGEKMAEDVAMIGRELWDDWFGGPNGVPGDVEFKEWEGSR